MAVTFELVWPVSRLNPSHQVIVARTSRPEMPPWLKYSVELRETALAPTLALKGKPVRRRKAKVAV